MITRLRRLVFLGGLFLLGIVLVGVLTYLAGTLGTRNPRVQVRQPLITVPPPLPGTPIARFQPLNPAIIGYLDQLDVSGYQPQGYDDLQPLGVYLPRAGNVQFEILDATPPPTPLAYPTSPPLPTPDPNGPVPTVPPIGLDGEPRILLPDDIGILENVQCAPAELPVDGLLTQRFHRFHAGIDLGVPNGTPVIATHSGRVIFADWSPIGYGYLVIIQNGSFITYYGHNSSFNVSADQFVGKGSVVAWSGNTGNSSGPHVHYETRLNDIPVDPLTFERRGYGTC